MADELISAKDLNDSDVKFTKNVPEEADPDAQGAIDMPLGFHQVEIHDFVVALHHEWTRKHETYICHQLRPKLRIPEGCPFAGARCQDFIPMPMGDQTITTDMMNLWYNFLRAFGFSVIKGDSAPTGFHPKQLIGANAVVEIVNQVDQDGIPKTWPDGRNKTGVRFFGYHSLGKLKDLQQRDAVSPNGKKGTGASKAPATPSAGFTL